MQSSGSPLYLQAAPGASPMDNVKQQHLEKEIANLVNSYRTLEQPGAIAVDPEGHVFIAQGGNDDDGTKGWVSMSPVEDN
ncbi:hypothetical protein SAMN05192562_10377 [Kosakonia arachidis]|uniref:Uncharacterized protein n=1 Tax=Kosakonia arachidis TaxID=551989 RepID=A0A1I7BZX5_9ENTR|nr:hypothetical protein [Kosakonia arachidis]SFT92726.1 hypothetical protein SAMN05192562_10377 [Kosakonia arachidis]